MFARAAHWSGFSFASPPGTSDRKRLAFVKLNYQTNVYLAELQKGGNKLTTPRRLTIDERSDNPTAWSRDSRFVVFWSNRNRPYQVFKQNVDTQTAGLIDRAAARRLPGPSATSAITSELPTTGPLRGQ